MPSNKFTVEHLRDQSYELFNTQQYVVDGVIVFKQWSLDTKVSLNQMRQAIQDFLNHKVS